MTMCCHFCNNEKSIRWYKSRTQCSSCMNKEWRNKNLEKSKSYRLKYYYGPEKRKSKENIFRKKHVRKATPTWVNKREIMKIYLDCPKGMQVDHIIPLRGKIVSGLHVPWNLQYLSPEENNKKQNYLGELCQQI